MTGRARKLHDYEPGEIYDRSISTDPLCAICGRVRGAAIHPKDELDEQAAAEWDEITADAEDEAALSSRGLDRYGSLP